MAAPEPKIVAYAWWCDDEVCDCTLPVVELVTPRQLNRWSARFGWDCKRLWEGTFHSQATVEDANEQRRELRAAAARYGITLDAGLHGSRPATPNELSQPNP
ncbi:MAG TPA: hypothetical protein VF157_10410 [Chloroflexota bacterium]